MVKSMCKNLTRTVALLAGLTLSLAACGEAQIIDAQGAEYESALPDLQFGKSDQSSNTSLGQRLEPGAAASGTIAGFVALPVSLSTEERLEVQTWTERPSVVMVYGPRTAQDWDLERVRAATRDIKPGVHSEYLRFVAPEAGEYLVVVGNGDEQPTRWILARPGRMASE